MKLARRLALRIGPGAFCLVLIGIWVLGWSMETSAQPPARNAFAPPPTPAAGGAANPSGFPSPGPGGGRYNVPETATLPTRNAPPVYPATSYTDPQSATAQTILAPPTLFDATETVARVGDQYIVRGELIGDANLMLAPAVMKMGPEEIEQNRGQMVAQRDMLLGQLLQNAIDRKLMYIEFMRSIPADKMEEAQASIQDRVSEAFEENLFKMLDSIKESEPEEMQALARRENQLFRLALLMKETDATSLGALEAILRPFGSSLESQQQAYAERVLGQQAMRQSIEVDPEITHTDMIVYYDENREEFKVESRARWQQLTARFDRYGTREETGQAIAAMGNELVLGGTPFWAVAQKSSDGSNADQGGYHDWTEWGNLETSQPINDAVFSLPINRLSPIIEDGEGLHIVRVLEREETHLIPFADAQVEIKERLKNKRRNESVNKYVAKLKERTPVWKTGDE